MPSRGGGCLLLLLCFGWWIGRCCCGWSVGTVESGSAERGEDAGGGDVTAGPVSSGWWICFFGWRLCCWPVGEGIGCCWWPSLLRSPKKTVGFWQRVRLKVMGFLWLVKRGDRGGEGECRGCAVGGQRRREKDQNQEKWGVRLRKTIGGTIKENGGLSLLWFFLSISKGNQGVPSGRLWERKKSTGEGPVGVSPLLLDLPKNNGSNLPFFAKLGMRRNRSFHHEEGHHYRRETRKRGPWVGMSC